MVKKKSGARKGAGKSGPFDAQKFANVLQVGGIRTGTLDYPNPNGAHASRVAHVNTGSGFVFTVALDRGGDLVEATHKGTNLVFLTPLGYKPPSHAYHRGNEWLEGWSGGLLTSCGPGYIGNARTEDGQSTTLHGHHSNTPAAVEMLINPDPARGRREMLLSLSVRSTRMFGPSYEVRRQIQCVLGEPVIHLYDQVINRGNTRVVHNWLYHTNFGYPLLDSGARFIYRGKLTGHWDMPAPPARPAPRPVIGRYKRVENPIRQHAGAGERGLLMDVRPDRAGNCHVGLINRKLKLAVELIYPLESFPRLANWQHYGPAGSYVTGVEPFNGSLMGKENDDHPKACQWLEPGQSRRYQMTIRVHDTAAGIAGFAKHDGPVA